MERVIIFFTLCFSVPCTAKAECNSNHRIAHFFGMRQESDKLLFKVHTTVPYRAMWWVSADVDYTPDENVGITYIELLDQTNSKGGCGEIISGGINKDHVKIKLQSQCSPD
ncbi:uncharacterized protein LOC106667864 isoform X2 [Cimex lectularius]|uniref:Uncharacterized protein n=1 Tax=Cimex lectularius TaxID=79782 RepID=A0A8I6RUI3_CIMLE|nr:uncharacterized protein LOC106667864 isoform X2 [Cimex lectularius]